MNRRRLSLLGLLMSALVAGCATTAGGYGTPEFPAKDRVDALADQPAAHAATDLDRATVDEWALSGPFPDHIGDAPVKGGDPLADLLLATVSPSSTSENVACAARELARFAGTHKERPEPRLERFLLERCGSTVGSVANRALTWSHVDDAVTDAQLVAQNKDALVEEIHALARDGALLGTAFVRDRAAKAAAAYVFSATPRMTVHPAAQAPSQGSFVLEGALAKPRALDALYADVNQGPLGTAECARDFTVELPAFRFTCPIAAGDATARIEVVARDHGRVLAEGLGGLLVVQDAAVASTWKRVEVAEPTPTPALAEVPERFLALLNDVRAKVGAPPLAAAPAQSATAARLVPHFFGAAFGKDRDDSLVDLVALGLMAGYDVEGMTIHNAGFAPLVDYAGRLDRVLGEALESPMLRTLLLRKTATQLAVGAQTVGKDTGLLVVDYDPLVPPSDAKAASSSVLDKLDAVRRQRGVTPIGHIPVDKLMLSAAQRVQAGEDSNKVAHEVVEAVAQKMKRTVRLWQIEAYDVDHMEFPDDLLAAHSTFVAASVATHKRPGSPWGSTMILIVYAVDDSVKTAAADRAPGSRG